MILGCAAVFKSARASVDTQLLHARLDPSHVRSIDLTIRLPEIEQYLIASIEIEAPARGRFEPGALQPDLRQREMEAMVDRYDPEGGGFGLKWERVEYDQP
jgi:hypothetical protein